MANVSSSNGLEKRPKLRFPGFDEPWKVFKAEELFQNVTDKNHPDETVLTIIQGKGTLPREQAGRNIHYDDASLSNYKKVEQGDFIIHLRSFEGGLEMANEAGIVSPAYTILRCKRPHSSLFYDAYFHTDEFINHNLSKSVEGIRDGRQISYEAFKWLGIPYCEPTEQEKISNLFAALNERIAKQRDLVESLKKYKRGVMRAIFRDKSFVFSKATVWKSISLGDECVFFSGGTPKSTDSSYYGGSIPFIRSGEIHGEKTELFLTEAGLQNSSAKMVSKGDLLIALYGATSGEVDISKIDGAINQAILCIRPYDMSKQYLRYLLEYSKDDIINTYLQGGQGNLSAEIIKNLRVDIPDSTAQSSVVEFLSTIDKRIEMSIADHEHIQAMKHGLLQQLFI